MLPLMNCNIIIFILYLQWFYIAACLHIVCVLSESLHPVPLTRNGVSEIQLEIPAVNLETKHLHGLTPFQKSTALLIAHFYFQRYM